MLSKKNGGLKMIIKARPEDKERVCELGLMASSCLYGDALKSADLNVQKDLLMKYYDMPMTKASREFTIVYLHEGKVVGCLVYYDGALEKELIANMEKVLDNDYKFSIEALDNTIYLDSIAVDANYRGLGIASKLINYAIERSDKDLSLLVETYKEDVRNYYERLGFKVVKRVEMFNSELDAMLYKK